MYFAVLATAFMVLAALGRVTHLRLLAASLAVVHLVAGVLEPSYIVFAAVEVVVVLLALHYWCYASAAVAKLSIVALGVHLAMYGWYQHPAPYDWFMVAYNTYPVTIRAIELAQLLAIVWWLPQVRSLIHRRNPDEKETGRWMEFSREV